MANRRSLAQRLLQARSVGVPAIIANFASMMASSTEELKPLCVVAFGDVLSIDHVNEADIFCTWQARVLIAEALANNWANTSGVRDSDLIKARMYGELVGLSSVKNQSSIDDRNRARTKLIGILREIIPSPAEFRSLVQDIIRRCKLAARGMSSPADYRNYVPVAERQQVSIQTLVFYLRRGHLIPSGVFEDQNSQVLWNHLSNTTHHWVDIPDEGFDLIEDYAALWVVMHDSSILGYYEGRAVQMVEKCRSIVGGSTFTYLASLAKESNVTQGWVSRRKMQFVERNAGLQVDDFISAPIIKHFVRMYGATEPTWEEVYKQLVVSWSIMQCSEGQSLGWIIEQSTNNNVTCLTTIADIVTRLPFFDLDLLLRKGLPEFNVVQSLTMARDLLRNPFSSLIRPSVNLRQYADLAYLCTYVKRDLLGDQIFAGYKGNATTMCVRTEHELRQLGRILFDISNQRTSADVSLHDLYVHAHHDENSVTKVIGGETFIIPTNIPNEDGYNADDEDAGRAAVRARREADLQDNLDRQMRAGWPRQALNLPAGSRLVPPEEMFNVIEGQASVRSRAFKLIMSRLHGAQAQVPLQLMTHTTLDVPRPEKQIQEDIQQALAVWGIPVDAAWMRDIDEYAPGAMPDVRSETARLVPRVTVNIEQVIPAAQE